MMDVELAQTTAICEPRWPAPASVGARWAAYRPLGVCVAPLGRSGLTPDEVGALLLVGIQRCHYGALRWGRGTPPSPVPSPVTGLEINPAAWPFLLYRQAVLASAPFISVVICAATT